MSERNWKDSEKLVTALVKAPVLQCWEQLSTNQWQGCDAEGDFCDSS